MNKKIYFSFLTFLVFSFFSINIFANEKNNNITYSLYDLCKIAYENAEKIKIAENNLVIAKQEKKKAISAFIPTITASGFTLKYNESDEYNPNISAYTINLNQSFTLNGKEIIAFKISKDKIKQYEFILQAVKDAYFLEVAKAYYQIFSRKKYVEISRADVERLEKHKNAVKERLKVGQVTKTALYRAEAELSGARTELLKSLNNLQLARSSLKNLVNISDTFTLSTKETKNFKDFVYSFEELKKQALEKRPEIQSAKKVFEISQRNIKLEKSDFWPTLSIQGTYSDKKTKYGENHENINYIEDTSIQANLSFTIFDGGLRSASLAQAIASKNKADLELNLQRKKIILETEKVWLNFQTSLSTLSTLKDELKFAQENYNAVKMQFEFGMADSIDIMDANTLLVKAQRKISDADYNHTFSILEIMRARGDIVSMLIAEII